MTITQALRSLLLLAPLALLAAPAVAPAQREGITREQMWWAPTEEDWKKPVLVQWQRSWEDALAVAEETGKPILICVNMDGEIASEHYAGIRYRQPEIAKLYEPYVCVIASTYRHTPRDHDEHGHRIPCPRFGGVTCGEHIAIEPILFEKFFDGERVAPRHIMVELDGSETYDVYYAFDTDSVFKAIGDGIANRERRPEPIVKGDRSIVERVASRDAADRVAVESAFRKGAPELRRSLLEAARKMGAEAPEELIRLGLSSFDDDLNRVARRALAQAADESRIDLIGDALRVPMDAEERGALVGALERIGETSARARKLAVVHGGLATSSKDIDVAGWTSRLEGAEYRPAFDAEAAEARLERMDEVFADEDPQARLELAEAFLLEAEEAAASTVPNRTTINALLADARSAALSARDKGASGWRVESLLCLASWYLGERDRAREHAVAAATAGAPEEPASYAAMVVLGLFAEARRDAVRTAIAEKRDWPKEWLTDVHAAYGVLAKHPDGDPSQVVAHYDFLVELGALGPASAALDAGIRRFPGSPVLHNRLRVRELKDKGIGGLEDTYAGLLAEEGAAVELRWFAGYASILAAEYHRRFRDRDAALEAYGRAIAHFDLYIDAEPDQRASADQYVAVAHGGRARIAYERRRDDEALSEVLAAFSRSPGTANFRDGLNISAVDTAKMLASRLEEAKETEMLARLRKGMAALDPSMLELPDYEPRGGGRRRGN